VKETLVRFHHVFKVYRIADTGVVALAGVDFDIGGGEFLAVVGPSGSGKSTVLNLAGGLDRSSSGEVEFQGQDLARLTDIELTTYRRDRVGFVWQGTARNLVPYLSLRENIGLPLIATGQRVWVRRKRVGELLEAVGLKDRANNRPGELSGGEQQRAAVAVALANLPPLLLADEPTAELDSDSAERVLKAFRDVNREFGVTVVMVTHDLLAARQADRMIRIRDGRIAADTHAVPALTDEGELTLPDPVVDVLHGAPLEAEVTDGEVRIRRKLERTSRRRPVPVAVETDGGQLAADLKPEPEPEPLESVPVEAEPLESVPLEPESPEPEPFHREPAQEPEDETGPDQDPYAEFRRPS
jgi:ABC-type lipoprotein export system ATPase subunit